MPPVGAYARYTGGGGYLPLVTAAWYYDDSAVDLDFQNDRYFVSPLASTDSTLVMLVHGDGVDAATKFPDSTGRHQLTPNADAQIDTAQKKFGTGSMLFDGTGDYILVDPNSDLTFGTASSSSTDFIIDCQIRIATTGVQKVVWTHLEPSVNSDWFELSVTSSDVLQIFSVAAGSAVITGTTALTTGTWYHVLLSRSGGAASNLKLFLNGTQEGSTYTTNANWPKTQIVLGANWSLSGSMNGWIDEFRIVSGAGQSSNFTSPSAAYTDPTPSGPYGNLYCSRASTGYAKTSAGALTSFSNNQLRRTNLGLLIEETRTNLILRSQEFGTSWTANQASVTADSTAAPDGTTTADTITENSAATQAHGIYQLVTTTTNTVYIYSVFAKMGTRRYLVLNAGDSGSNRYSVVFDLQNGTVGTGTTFGTVANTSSSIESFSSSFYRCAIGLSFSGTLSIFGIWLSDSASPSYDGFGQPTYTGDGSSNLYVWGAQQEAGTFASSYIPTTSASATRATDTVTCIGPMATTLIAAIQSVIAYIALTAIGSGNSLQPRIVGANNGNFAFLLCENSTQLTSYDGTGLTATLGSSLTFTSYVKVGSAQDGTGRSVVGGGGTVATDGHSFTLDPVLIGFGSDSTREFFGIFRRLTGWSIRLADATLQSRTSP